MQIGRVDANGGLELGTEDLARLLASAPQTGLPDALGPDHAHAPLHLPHPALMRGDVELDMLRRALVEAGHGGMLADPLTGEACVMRALQALAETSGTLAPWRGMHRAMYASVCLAFMARGGRILRATDALEALLEHTDVDIDTPTSMFQPPHPALYVHFGARWREHIRGVLAPALALAGVSPEDAVPHGCYLLQSRTYCPSCDRNQRTIGLYLVVELLDEPRSHAMCGGAELILHDEAAPLSETLVEKIDAHVPGGVFGALPRVEVGLLSKLFLYADSQDAHLRFHDDFSTLQRRLGQVGIKKTSKLQRRGERLYDWHEVGPAALPSGLGAGELPPHWRRGHLRQQAHGPQRSQRKTIFVAPTLVGAGKLASQAPQ